MIIPPKPERWEILCHNIGLALLLGQKLQFALAYYLGVHQAVRGGLNENQLDAKVSYFLSKPMGVVVSEIKQKAPLPDFLSKNVDEFKTARNWLVHNFDEEATPHISRGQKIDEYITRMEQITQEAISIMNELDKIGDELMIEKGVDPQEIKRIVEERRKNESTF
ncbi:hypothetical protein ACFL9T_19410 [Thermodesulfobacteriota bacterium]